MPPSEHPPLAEMTPEWLIGEVRLLRMQLAKVDHDYADLSLRHNRASNLLAGLAEIVRRLPKRPKVEQRECQEIAIAWVQAADYETSGYVDWGSPPPVWADPDALRKLPAYAFLGLREYGQSSFEDLPLVAGSDRPIGDRLPTMPIARLEGARELLVKDGVPDATP